MSDDLCGSVRWWREHSGVCYCGGGAPAGKSSKLYVDKDAKSVEEEPSKVNSALLYHVPIETYDSEQFTEKLLRIHLLELIMQAQKRYMHNFSFAFCILLNQDRW